MSDPVRQQYEAYPYPSRDPEAERRRLVTGSPSQLGELDHHLFGGRRDFGRPFRALVAGGGTGDAAIMLAQQLADRGGPAEVVHLDLSAASRRIAAARAAVRGLANIRFVAGAIEELPALDLGAFDYIDCCGVLHHLADPPAALTLLADALAPGGGLGIMVYGPLGRTGVYPMQDMLRRLAGDRPLPERVTLARRLQAALPATNWLRHNAFLGDHAQSDAELVDLFLHSRDRAYSVPELAELVAAAGLEIVSLIEPARYEPASYLADPALLEALAPLGPLERAAVAESLVGNLRKHIAYLAPNGTAAGRQAPRDRPEGVPVMARFPGPQLAQALARDGALVAELDGLKLRLPVPELAPALVARIDGRTSLAQIHGQLQRDRPDLDWFAFQAAFEATAAVLVGMNLMWLRLPPLDTGSLR